MDDARLTPARPDLAAKYLEGKVNAARFVEGAEFEIIESVAPLRSQGETVVCVLPGHEQENDEFECDRELVQAGGQWVLRSL